MQPAGYPAPRSAFCLLTLLIARCCSKDASSLYFQYFRQQGVLKAVRLKVNISKRGRVGTIHSSEANLDRHRVAVHGRAKAHFTGPKRRRALIYLLASAIIPLIGTDAFSNPGHKQVASHHIKAAKAENRKHPSPTEAKHSERAPGPRILLPRDPTSADDVTPAPLPPDLAAVKQAVRLIQQHKFSEATALTASINDPAAQKLVEWAYLRDSESPAGFDRYNAFLKANPEWSSMLLRRRAEARLARGARRCNRASLRRRATC